MASSLRPRLVLMSAQAEARALIDAAAEILEPEPALSIPPSVIVAERLGHLGVTRVSGWVAGCPGCLRRERLARVLAVGVLAVG